MEVQSMDSGSQVSKPEHVPSTHVVDFNMFAPVGARDDYHLAWKALQAPGMPDIVWTAHNEGHWIITSGRLIHSAFADYQTFSSRVVWIPKSSGEHLRLPLITFDPPDHRYPRALLAGGISPKIVHQRHDAIRTFAVDLIEGLRPQGRCDFVKDFAEQLPLRVFMDIVDLPFADAGKIKFLVDKISRPTPDMTFEQVAAALVDYAMPIALSRRGGSGADMITRMVNGKFGDRDLTDREAAELCVQALVGGVDTVVNMLGFIMSHLAQSPAHRAALAGDRGLIGNAVEEYLRRFPIIADAREVRDDVEFAGVHLKRGDMVLLPTALHGLDERENQNPMEVDFNRPQANHSSFGNGPHKCPGAALARAELNIVLEEWMARIPEFELAPARKLAFGAGMIASVERLELVWEI